MEIGAREFFSLLYPLGTKGWLGVWTRQDKLTRYFPATPEGLEAAAEEARRLDNEGKDVYFAPGLRREKLPPRKRGTAEDTIAIPGLWADVDVQEGKHAKAEKYPPRAEALEALTALPCPPTALVDTGGGFHAYWLFPAPWVFEHDQEREEAARLSRQFQEALAALWQERGWKLDITADLARALRVPGTHNWKAPADPRQVQVVRFNDRNDRRYSVEELSRWSAEVLAAKGGGIGEAATAVDATEKNEVDVAAVVEAVRPWWTEGDRHNRALALAGFLAKRGVTQEAAEEVVARLAEEMGDGEVKDRLRAVADTYQKLVSGQAVVGLAALPRELAEKLDSLVRRPDPVKAILADLGDPPRWPRLFEQAMLRRLAGLSAENLQRFLAELRARGGAKVVSPAKLEKAVVQVNAKMKAEKRGLEVLPGGGDPTAAGRRYIVDRFPPAAEVLPHDFPFPDAGKHSFYDIRGGRVVKVAIYEGEDGRTREAETTVCDAVVLLTKRVSPVEQDAGIEKWRVAWWERGVRQERDLPAAYIFDTKKVGELINAGLPVSSTSAAMLVDWLHRLRCMAVLGHHNAPPLPAIRAVSRCGWHALDGERFFAWGREILRADRTEAADAGDREEIQPDAGLQTDADIRWAEDISALERQVLSAFRCGGDPSGHRRFLLEAAAKYPQIAFALGLAAGAPLLRFARERGLIEVDGFSVLMVPRGQGRSRHQGKTTWNAVVASFYGWPMTGPEGRLRYADQTHVARALLFSTCCDLTVHFEELQRLVDAAAGKKTVAAELAHLFQQVSGGQDRDRGARGGGGRRTRGFYVVLFATAETDVTTKLPPEAGAHERILKLPPLLQEENDKNAEEAERLLKQALANHGHAGREYLAWLVRKVSLEGTGFITQALESSLEELRHRLPTDARRASAWRLASRAAVGLAGWRLLLESLKVSGEEAEEAQRCLASFTKGWEMVLDGISEETVAGRALEAVADFVTVNQEAIEGLRTPDPDHPKTPPRWLGVVTSVHDDEREIDVLALPFEVFAEAVAKEPYALDPEHALQALAKEGYVVTKKVRENGREKRLLKMRVRINNVRTYCVCIPLVYLHLSEEDTSAGTTPDVPVDSNMPF